MVQAAPAEWSPPKPAEVPGVKVVNVKPKAPAAAPTAPGAPRAVKWPAPGSAEVDLSSPAGLRSAGAPGGIAAGQLPVRIGRVATAPAQGRAATSAAPARGRMRVTVHDRETAARVGTTGLLLDLTRTDGTAGSDGAVSVSVDYSGFAHAYGGGWSSRLRLVQLPACALTRPADTACITGRVLDTVNDEKSGTVTATALLRAAGASVLSVEGGPSGDDGDYRATDLSSAGSWEVSKQTGDFTWSLPLRMPPSQGGPAPQISLAYSSSSVDGRTTGTNNQGGWVGDGWEYWPGFIERKYIPCSDDKPTSDKRKTGDQCWFNDNATLSLSGRAGDLVRDGDVWRMKNDDGTRVERLRSGSRDNGDNDNEYWKVSTPDGTEYYFGYHKLPGWKTDDATTDSTWTVPVFGDDKTDECYDDTFAEAHCRQAWRWNLDYVVDPNGNTLAYYYGREGGAYARNGDPDKRTTYHRGGYLKRAEYGMRSGAEYGQAAPLRAVFTTEERCLADCWAGKAWESDPKRGQWPDTPWDQFCKEDTKCREQGSPTYWSARRLTTITTQKRSGPTSYADVESWTLRHTFDSPGSGESTPLWLAGVTRAGHIGDTTKDPEIAFDHGAESLDNRVDAVNDSRTGLKRWRIKRIGTESGGDILVTYAGGACDRDKLPDPKNNKTRCMPAYYAWPGTGEPTIDWFHKYVVTRVDHNDTVTDQPTQTTFYDYLDDPAWHYQDDEITKDKHKTWGDWRGYGKVRVRQGTAEGRQTATEYRYLRGMNGDKGREGTVEVTDWGGTVVDHEALNGFLRQEITFDGATATSVGRELFSTVHVPWKRGPTATRTRSGVTTNTYVVQTGSSRTRTAMPNGKWRITGTVTEHNDDGLPVTVTDLGDEAVTGDETCTRTTYGRNPASDDDGVFMVDKVIQTELLSRVCAGAPATAVPSTVLSRTRTFYDAYKDASSFGNPPVRGNVVRVEELDAFKGATPVYVRTQSSRYDSNGRAEETTDARGNTSRTKYVTAHGGLLTATEVTDALGHTVTTAKEPAWDLPTSVTDANRAVTTFRYDGLGRTTAVWLPGRSTPDRPTMKFSYLVRKSGGPTAIVSEHLLTSGSNYKATVTLYDGFLRKRQVQTSAPGGGRHLADTFHNAHGKLAWESQPYHDTTNAEPGTDLGRPQGQIPGLTEVHYDGAGRETDKVFKALGAEKWRTTTIHDGDRQTVIPPLGGTATTAIVDAHERTTELRQYRNVKDAGKDDPTLFDTIQYDYDLRGNLEKIVDAASNVWSYTYDLRGRQRTADDPDKGLVKTSYDAAGNVETVEDAGGKVIAYTYDKGNRKWTVRDGSVTGPKRAEWFYDDLENGAGKLSRSVRYVGGVAYESRVDAYDTAGRPTKTSVVLPAGAGGLCAAEAAAPCVYSTDLTYKQNGSPATTTLPKAAQLPAEKLTYGYNDVGEQTSLISPTQIYVGSVVYDKLGQLTQRELGNVGNRVSITSTFDGATRRLAATNVVPERKAEAANYSYDYDAAGNVTMVSDAPQGQKVDTQCYSYDYLRRLTDAWTPRSNDCKAAPDDDTALDGPAPYWHSWTYDRTGNRTQEVRHSSAGDTTLTYTYPTAGAAAVRPHAVTSVLTQAPGKPAVSREFTYDDAGNMRTRSSGAGAQQMLTWDAEGRLESVSESGGTTSFVYDADGNRLMRKDAAGSTVFLPGGTELTLATGATAAKATRYYSHKETVVATRSDAGLFWLVGDHHGTVEMAVNALTLAVTKRRTLPFGEIRGGAPAGWPATMDKGFVGGTADRTGLTHLGARLYDPLLGRFISVDPVIDPQNPQQLNGYSYANNNPGTMSDPTGLYPSHCATQLCAESYTPPAPKKTAPKKTYPVANTTSNGRKYIWNPMLGMTQEQIDARAKIINTATVKQALTHFASGREPRHQEYYQVDEMTLGIRSSDHMDWVRQLLTFMIGQGGYDPDRNINYDLPKGEAGSARAKRDLLTMSLYGTSSDKGERISAAEAAVGSYRLNYQVAAVDPVKGRAVVAFTATNTWDVKSMTRPPWIDKASWNPPEPASGRLSDVTQTFSWVEVIPFSAE
ncbi:hypothetical protein Sya03_06590 [Spirilliplanes yamanashiensis]|uniref:Teneurin-like YD-shell domain-containing protein n=1 Tax=Spirilliplanes yamanashiensis TaxID=42233 RepID=A0A8J3Y4J0_9ACTN|nr:hypothetical protein Sya03_06590 [Spirilliplanes yamanashiensis]